MTARIGNAESEKTAANMMRDDSFLFVFKLVCYSVFYDAIDLNPVGACARRNSERFAPARLE
jgi:hypothetical protein